jgi:hypothetical protein
LTRQENIKVGLSAVDASFTGGALRIHRARRAERQTAYARDIGVCIDVEAVCIDRHVPGVGDLNEGVPNTIGDHLRVNHYRAWPIGGDIRSGKPSIQRQYREQHPKAEQPRTPL